MARYDPLPIWKDAVALTALLEEGGCAASPAITNTPWVRIYAARRMPSAGP